MLNEMCLRASDEELAASDSWRHVLRRQISFFGEEDSLERLIALAGTFDHSANLRKPVRLWFYVEAQLRDLICKMTNLDPEERITAREALEHPWFAQSD
jgi:serine/threonine protein kinase